MCYNGKCLFCIKVETGTMIFAIINVVIAALLTLAAVIVLIIFNVVLETAAQDNILSGVLWTIGYNNPAHVIASALGNIILGVITLIIIVHFTFAVLLADGICKKETSKIKAYFVYGVFVNICWYLITIGFCAANNAFEPIVHVLIIQFVFTAILVMIRMTYLKIGSGAVYGHVQQQENHYKPLIEMRV